MQINFHPIRSSRQLTASANGDVLTVNGSTFDLSVLGLGFAALSIHPLVARAERTASGLVVDLALPHASDPPEAVLNAPSLSVDNGPIPVPSFFEETSEIAEDPDVWVPLEGQIVNTKAVVFPDLTPRQLWLAALQIGVTKAQVLELVAGLEDPLEAASLTIELTEATTFRRDHPAVASIAALLAIPAEQLDDLWIWAASV